MLKQPRIRSKKHLAFVAERPCCVCRRKPVQVHHLLRCIDLKARGVKAGDNWTVPLCLYCHTALHAMGDERAWAERNEVDLVEKAQSLWARSPANRPETDV